MGVFEKTGQSSLFNPIKADVFRLQVVFDPLATTFPSLTRLLYTAERFEFGRNQPGVDTHHPTLKSLCDTVNLFDAARKKVRRKIRHVVFQAALVASPHNPVLKTFADRLREAGKPHKVVITAITRKLVTIVNALCKTNLKWAHPTS